MRGHRAWVVLAMGAVLGLDAAGAVAGENVMKFARYRRGDVEAFGIVEGDRVRRISGDPFGAWQKTDEAHPLADVTLLVPSRPTKVLAVGLNYKSHLGTRPQPKVPEIFLKPPSCLVPSGSAIVIPKGTDDVHFEGELVIVVGKRARRVSPGEAASCVLGMSCGNDVSARDWQKNDLQWWRAKGADTFGPCGPFVVAGLDYDNLALQTRVNGEVKQRQRTSDLIFPVAEIVSWCSQYVTLEPGDLIYTGTPGATSALKPGDVVEVEIEGIGTLTNPVVKSNE